LAQDYPPHLLEIIIVDDHSTDDTAAIANAFQSPQVTVLSLASLPADGKATASFKKKALASGIARSKGTLIVTTDADCTAGPQWLRQIAACYEAQNPTMIVAPVAFSNNNTIVEVFQAIDFMTMQGITAATVQGRMGIMCNGANLAFTRRAYEAVNGYDGIDHIVSGDDYLLMMKIRQQFSAASIAYLKASDAIVLTPPQPDWRSFLQQRIRWASKTGKYRDPLVTAILLLVYCFNTLLLLLLVATFFNPRHAGFLILLWTIKVLMEMIFLAPVAHFYKKEKLLWWFPFLQPLHSCYIFIAGFFGAMGKYSWKDRRA
jgi:cellulose synthase/poly-beta-1,6-N-acetylglucosamine synthase-like glycosyltransferase